MGSNRTVGILTFDNNPLVAILTPSFNREDLVAATLDSIAAQTYSNWENIIVDDGSTDRTMDIIAEYASCDPRFQLHKRSREPKGACTCRNEGVALSQAKYVMFLDTDDIIEPFCLEQRVAAMEGQPDLDFGIFPSLMFRDRPNDLGLWWNIDKSDDELARQFRQDAICQGTGVLWRKESFERLGRWDETLALWQDIDLFLRAYIQDYRYEKFFELPPDLHNRITRKSLSRGNFYAPEKTRSRQQVVQRAVALLKEHGKKNRVRESRYMIMEIASGAARSGQGKLARSFLKWALEQGAFSSTDMLLAQAAVFLYTSRLFRLPGFRYITNHIEHRFKAPDVTLGLLPYQPQAIN